MQGVSFAVMMPTRQSWIPQLVRRDDLTSALALNNAGMNASRVIGPSLAGVLIAVPWFGVKGVYFVRILAFAWVLYTLLRIPILGEPEASAAARQWHASACASWACSSRPGCATSGTTRRCSRCSSSRW